MQRTHQGVDGAPDAIPGSRLSDPQQGADVIRPPLTLCRRPQMSAAGAYISRLAHLVAGGATGARPYHKRLRFQTRRACRRDPHSEVNTRLSHGSIRLSPDAFKTPCLRNPLPRCGNDNSCWGAPVGNECRIIAFLVSVAASCVVRRRTASWTAIAALYSARCALTIEVGVSMVYACDAPRQPTIRRTFGKAIFIPCSLATLCLLAPDSAPTTDFDPLPTSVDVCLRATNLTCCAAGGVVNT